jgi:hypothetical protein
MWASVPIAGQPNFQRRARAAMSLSLSLSSVSVIGNALRLRKMRL